jgi:hypothetical protein
MSKKAVADFIAKVSSDASLLKRFQADPDAVLDEQPGLTADDKAVLKSNNADKVRAHLGDDAPPGCFTLFV